MVFLPDQANKPSTPGAAVADAEGAYELSYRDRRGVAPGKYKVVVEPAFSPAGSKLPAGIAADPIQAKLAAAPAKKKGKAATEPRPVQGEFFTTVPESGGGTFDLDVKSPPPAGVARTR